MFLKKLNLSKKELNAITIATGILVLAILAIISLMQPTLNQEEPDIRFLGYQYTQTETAVLVKAPVDEEPFSIVVAEENEHDLESVGSTLKSTYSVFQRFIRNIIIFLYIVFFYIVIRKKKATQFHGVFRGVLLGAGFILLLLTLQLGLDVTSGLTKFGHDFIHLVPLV